MRLYVRNNILELINTITEGIEYINKENYENSRLLIEDCFYAFRSVSEILQKYLSEKRFTHYNELIISLEKALKKYNDSKNDCKEGSEECFNILLHLLNNLKNTLQDEPEVKIEILFLPYKSSMWDSLESIWVAAKDDSRCDCYVMPIPYYDRDENRQLAEFHYEGEQFPNYVPITSYLDYNIAERRPDVIYFHNPYDGNNLVTSVAPEYYSDNLKQYTDMLVYVPYFIAGAYRNAKQASSKCLASGVINANRVIVQSEVLRDIYIRNGISPKKVIALGSPKIDAVLNDNETLEIPKEWKMKITGKKVILLNSSIGALLNNPNYMLDLEKIIQNILSNKDVLLLWRPHPLLEATIKSMRNNFLNAYNKLKRAVKNSENGILDQSSNSKSAVYVSNAMISDNSSLIRTYIMSEKPILILESSNSIKHQVLLSCDIYSCYFYNDGISVEKFIEMVLEGEDPMIDNRVCDYKNSLVNIDGSCGINTHRYIFNELQSCISKHNIEK